MSWRFSITSFSPWEIVNCDIAYTSELISIFRYPVAVVISDCLSNFSLLHFVMLTTPGWWSGDTEVELCIGFEFCLSVTRCEQNWNHSGWSSYGNVNILALRPLDPVANIQISATSNQTLILHGSQWMLAVCTHETLIAFWVVHINDVIRNICISHLQILNTSVWDVSFSRSNTCLPNEWVSCHPKEFADFKYVTWMMGL